MVIQSSHYTGIPLPLTTEFGEIAQRFAQQCPFSEKAQQIRRNTLAVCAVNAYLQLMDIPTCISESDSWNPMMQMLADVADLKVPGVGTLSCRSLALQDSACYVPPEEWQDRAGYVAVVIDEAASQAILVGFTPIVTQEIVPLEQFSPLEALLDRVHSLQAASAASVEPSATEVVSQARSAVTQLSQWVDGVMAATWQATDAIVNPTGMNFAFRTTALANRSDVTDISRAKLIDLGLQLGQTLRIALVVHLVQAAETGGPDVVPASGRTDIILQVRPIGDSPYLCEGLVLRVLDEENNSFMQATSRAIDNYIQLRLSGQSGETFGVQIAAEEGSFTEWFVI
ncbi:MAG: DUF1822 family protein [Phormidesmis sp.]